MLIKRSFTLIETLIAVAVLGVIGVSIGGIFFAIQRSWQKQKADLLLLVNARWGLEFMSREVRHGGGDNIGNDETGLIARYGTTGLYFSLDTDYDEAIDTIVIYWKGTKDAETEDANVAPGDRTIIYRGISSKVNVSPATFADAWASRKPLITDLSITLDPADVFSVVEANRIGNLRVKGYLHLTAAYRSLPRPCVTFDLEVERQGRAYKLRSIANLRNYL
jgi:type II secretory pathway pseudopilin PulG